ncbi:MAG TPA: hypothetical protein P5262_00380 [Candidatus Moranbacteria bacterium]|nr:hypothetical protein [Candidatus Moranbacteria bacterium]
MGLQDKIDEIRQKPEYIRIRYVWMWVSISMVFVVAIWIVSIVAQNKKNTASEITPNPQILEQFKDQKKSLEDVTGQMKSGFQGQGNLQNQN